MMDQSGTGPLLAERHCQRGRDESDPHVIPHRPTDDLAAEQVHDSRQVQPPLRGWNVGDIGEPDPVWRCGGEVTRDQVRRDRQIVTTVGGAKPTRARHDRSNAISTHQPFDPAAAGTASLRPQSGMDPWTAIALTAVAMDLPDL